MPTESDIPIWFWVVWLLVTVAATWVVGRVAQRYLTSRLAAKGMNSRDASLVALLPAILLVLPLGYLVPAWMYPSDLEQVSGLRDGCLADDVVYQGNGADWTIHGGQEHAGTFGPPGHELRLILRNGWFGGVTAADDATAKRLAELGC